MKRHLWPLVIFLVLVAFLGVGLGLKPSVISDAAGNDVLTITTIKYIRISTVTTFQPVITLPTY